MKYVQNIEQQLEMFTKITFSNPNIKRIFPYHSLFMPLNGLDKHKSCRHKLFGNRAYHLIDFNDFIDYATSDLPKKVDFSSLPEKQILFYESLSNENSIIFETECDRISILGCAFARFSNWVTIAAQFRSHDLFKVYKERIGEPQISEDPFLSKITFYTDQELPYFLILLNMFQEDDKQIYENTRLELLPPHITGDHYRESFKFYDYDGILSAFEDSQLPEEIQNFRNLLEAFSDKVENHSDMEFELTRLMLNLPSYVDFMYDLVVEEKKKIGFRKRPITKKKKRVSQSGKPIYKIIKSIRIVHDEEIKMEKESGSTIRKWTPPNYRFRVRGHWRELQQPWSKGHAPDGSEILGKTWITAYEKGKDKEPLVTEVVERIPKVVINLKQTLAYGRDVLKSHKRSEVLQELSQRRNLENKIVTEDKPTEEWMYKERMKLSASIRYMILRRDNFQCVLCGAKGSEGARLEVDHIKPLIIWGTTVERNLRTLCKECNRGKGIKNAT